MNSTASTVITPDNGNYQEVSRASVYFNPPPDDPEVRYRPTWFFVLDDKEPIRVINAECVIESITGAAWPENGAWRTVRVAELPPRARLIAQDVTVETAADSLRSILRRLDNPTPAPLNALLADLAEQRRHSFAENRAPMTVVFPKCISCDDRGFVDRDDECGMSVQVECPKCGQGV